MPATKSISLMKGTHRHVYRYEVGEESAVLAALVERVHDKDFDFDWFDAAVLSHQLGEQLTKELKAFLPKVK